MTEDIDEIRRKKALELMASLESKTPEEQERDLEEIQDILPWSWRQNLHTGFNELLHHPQMRQSADDPNVVAITVDPEFALMMTEMLNRAFMFKEAAMAAEAAQGNEVPSQEEE